MPTACTPWSAKSWAAASRMRSAWSIFMSRSAYDAHRDLRRAAYVGSRRPGDAVEVDGEVGAPRQQLRQRHPGLQPRRRGAQAVVAALAEGEQLAGPAAYVEQVRV